MITDRYLLKETALPCVAITGGLLFVFASYTVTRYLGLAASGQLAFGVMLHMIGLRLLIALEVLLPLGLYLGLIVGLGRLYGDHEMIALQAGGLSRVRMLRPLLGCAVIVALLVAAVSIVGRPWAYGQLYTLERSASVQLDLGAITPQQFYSDNDDTAVVYAEQKSDDGKQLKNVFASFNQSGRRVVIRAAAMTRARSENAGPTLNFHHGHLYRLDAAGQNDQVLDFTNLRWHLQRSDSEVGYKTKATPSARLLASDTGKDIAERQWRFSRPIATVFLALLGIALARSAPRRSRAGNAFAAAVAFGLYYNVADLARNWVENNTIPAFPGIYWVDAAVAVLTFTLLFRRRITHY